MITVSNGARREWVLFVLLLSMFFALGIWVPTSIAETPEEAIRRIQAGRHTPMPPPTTAPTSGPAGKGMTIDNGTGQTLHVHFSGPVGRTVVVPDGRSESVELAVGDYDVAAEVPGSRIIPFLGRQAYEAFTHYWLKFYTQRVGSPSRPPSRPQPAPEPEKRTATASEATATQINVPSGFRVLSAFLSEPVPTEVAEQFAFAQRVAARNGATGIVQAQGNSREVLFSGFYWRPEIPAGVKAGTVRVLIPRFVRGWDVTVSVDERDVWSWSTDGTNILSPEIDLSRSQGVFSVYVSTLGLPGGVSNILLLIPTRPR